MSAERTLKALAAEAAVRDFAGYSEPWVLLVHRLGGPAA